jgi:hypothetical protein
MFLKWRDGNTHVIIIKINTIFIIKQISLTKIRNLSNLSPPRADILIILPSRISSLVGLIRFSFVSIFLTSVQHQHNSFNCNSIYIECHFFFSLMTWCWFVLSHCWEVTRSGHNLKWTAWRYVCDQLSYTF